MQPDTFGATPRPSPMPCLLHYLLIRHLVNAARVLSREALQMTGELHSGFAHSVLLHCHESRHRVDAPFDDEALIS